MQEVQAVCDRIVIIHKGKIVADGSTEELKSSFQNKTKLVLELIAKEEEIHSIKESIEDISILSITPKENEIQQIAIEYDSEKDKRIEIYNFIKSKDWVLLEMHREHISLEAVFRNLTIEEGEEK